MSSEKLDDSSLDSVTYKEVKQTRPKRRKEESINQDQIVSNSVETKTRITDKEVKLSSPKKRKVELVNKKTVTMEKDNSTVEETKSVADTEEVEKTLTKRKTEESTNKEQIDNKSGDSKKPVETKKAAIKIPELKKLSFQELFKKAEEMGVSISGTMLKEDLVFSIVKKAAELNHPICGGGVIEVLNEGFGFTRSPQSNYLASADDVYLSPGQIRKLSLRAGDDLYGELRLPRKEERYLALLKALSVNENSFNSGKRRIHFDGLTPLYPDSHLRLECNKAVMHNNKRDLSARVIDIVAPLGRGQRALIVAPPKTGKTMLMQNISNSISTNYKEMKLIVLLIGERPEEVTDMERSVEGEVVSSTFDEPASRHVQLAELVIERAKRMVENGHDVVILLDSITRLARAYNAVVPSSGKVLTGGVDSNALQRPKRFFGAARNIENGGSLTIIATALVDTGSKMDEVIFEEFKGTGNSEIILDRKLSEKRIFPTIDITKSGTRREELLLSQDVLSKTWILRRILSPMGVVEAMEFLQEKFVRTKNNAEFFELMKNGSS